MSIRRKAYIANTLRKRIEHSLQTRALSPGDRLPSTREIGSELDADPRVVLAAYQMLADDGLVVLRPRSGVFVSPVSALPGVDVPPSTDLLAEVLVRGVVRGFSLLSFTDSLRIAAFGRTLRAAVIAGTVDQVQGLCRELRVDYGLQSTGIHGDELKPGSVVPAAIRRAHLLVTTQRFGAAITQLAAQLEKPVVVVNVRPAFMGEEWQTVVRRGRVYVVAVDPGFLSIARDHLQTALDLGNIKMLIAGRDDLGIIPPDAPTYVTEAARQKLGKMRVPGRLIPPTRLFAEDSVRAIVNFIVARNTSDNS
ncbi:MAG: winged helix-turn-helix domain-containing protein [Gemmatimonadota bacterium]|nr:winged helix-turn-helix domain-containing protein [Gemmatimonadota bacterium]